MQALSHIVRPFHYDSGLLFQFELMNGRYEAACNLIRTLENNMDYQSIRQLVDQASGTWQDPPCQRE